MTNGTKERNETLIRSYTEDDKGSHVMHSIYAGKLIRTRVANTLLITRKAAAAPIVDRAAAKE